MLPNLKLWTVAEVQVQTNASAEFPVLNIFGEEMVEDEADENVPDEGAYDEREYPTIIGSIDLGYRGNC